MNVRLISHTPCALPILVFTKNTRLTMNGISYDEILDWPEDRLLAEWERMKGTIQSSWEFVDYVFCITGVSRAFTHQLVRSRVGTSFAQQSQRAVDMSGFDFISGPTVQADVNPNGYHRYQVIMADLQHGYEDLLEVDVSPQDARGILPTNVATNIVFKANLRTLHDMAKLRLCVRTQGEYQEVFKAIRDKVVRIHPWAEDVLQVYCGWHGTCAFPALPMDQCEIKPFVYDPTEGCSYEGLTPDTLIQIRDRHRRMESRGLQPPVSR